MAVNAPAVNGPALIAARMNRLPLTRTHRRLVLTVGLAMFFDMYEIFMSGVLGAVMRERYHLDRTEVSAVLASVFVGMFIGVLAVGRLSDRLGRRRALLLGVCVYTVFSAVGALTDGVPQLIAARLLAGLGIGPVLPLADAYLSDLLPARARGRWTAWAYTVAFFGVPAVGLTARWLVPLKPLGVDGWRWLFLIGSAGGLIVLALRRHLVESPRWLASVGRTAEADEVLRRLEAEAGVTGAGTAAEVPDRPKSEAGAAGSGARIPAPAKGGEPAKATPASGEPVRAEARRRLEPVHRKRVAMMAVFHLLQAFGGYGFGTIAPLVLATKGYSIVSSLLFSALTFAGYPLGSLISIPLIERVERKFLIVGAALGMAVSGLAFGHASGAPAIIAAGVCYTAVSNVFSNGYHVYQAEIFPTTHRVAAVAATYSLSRIATAAMPFLMVPLLERSGADVLFAVVAATLVAIALDIGLLGPRVNGQTLEDVNEALAARPGPTPPAHPGPPGPAAGAGGAAGPGSGSESESGPGSEAGTHPDHAVGPVSPGSPGSRPTPGPSARR
ncbi:MFS transporter [Kitasatospora sp. NPDC058170]|uniref:MFS transporter n=1 Tax=Kitasatospora sp. NPDC058170 TaxID=3346364 RepID=UPI0036DAD999